MMIEIKLDKEIGGFYHVMVNGETVLECLNEDEVNALKISELKEYYKEVKKPSGIAYRVYNADSDETITVIYAKDIYDACRIICKNWGGRSDVDVELFSDYLEREGKGGEQ